MIDRVTKDACRAALDACREEFLGKVNSAASGGTKLAGIEEIFHVAFVSHFRAGAGRSDVSIGSKVKLADVGATRPDGSGDPGFMDAVLKLGDGEYGFEFKVLRLPRGKNLSPGGSLYDLGQITWDHARIRNAKGLQGGYCLCVLHGPLLGEEDGTESKVRRNLHDMLFIDYKRSQLWGELSDPDERSVKRQQLLSLMELGLDKPFDTRRNSRDSDFCVIHPQKDVAVVALWAGG